MADILAGFAALTPQQIALADRLANKVKQLKSGTSNTLSGLIQQRTSNFNLFWNDPSTPPQAVVAALEADSPGQTYSLFQHDLALVAFLVARLKVAGCTDAAIATMLPGVPDQYTVVMDDTAKTVSITVMTS